MARWTPFPLIGGAYSDDTKPWSAQDCLNYIPVPAEREGTRSSGKLVGVPGMATITASMQEAPVRGLHDVEGVLLAVTGNKLYRIGNDGAATEIGIVPGVGMVSMAHNQVQYGHEVMIANGQSGYVYNTYTGEFGQVSDDGFPGFKVVDFIDGYIAGIEPQGRFWAHSNLRDAKDYNTLDRYDAESAPDKMVSLIVSHREVMILNQRSASFFRNMGAATGTFQNSSGTELEVGGASTFAVARLDNTVYWLGNDGIVYRLAGHSPQRVSTGPIEQAIARCDISKAFAFTFEDRGHKVFYLTFPDGQTWGFDVWTNEWHRRASENLNRWRINTLVKWRGKWIAGDFSNGRLYQLDWAVQHEAGGVLERRRTTAVLHDNQNRVTVNGVELVVDTGLASVPDPILAPLSISGDLPDGLVGKAITPFTYNVSGGVFPYGNRTITAGSLPPGLSMDAAGTVTGTPTTAGSYSWTVGVTDAKGEVATLADAAAISTIIMMANPGNVTGQVHTSPDGTTWAGASVTGLSSQVTGLFAANARAYAFANSAANMGVLTEDGGATWQLTFGLPAGKSATSMTYSVSDSVGHYYCFLADGGVYVSVDGVAFSELSTGIASTGRVWSATKGATVIFGYGQSSIARSTDGGQTYAAAYSQGGSLRNCAATPTAFIAVGTRAPGSPVAAIFRSATGENGTWTEVFAGFPSNYSIGHVAYGDGRIVATGTSNAMAYSDDDGLTWTVGPSAPRNVGGSSASGDTAIAHYPGLFVAVGMDKSICTMPSAGAPTWTQRSYQNFGVNLVSAVSVEVAP